MSCDALPAAEPDQCHPEGIQWTSRRTSSRLRTVLPCCEQAPLSRLQTAAPGDAEGMTDRDDFLAKVKTALYEAELALHGATRPRAGRLVPTSP